MLCLCAGLVAVGAANVQPTYNGQYREELIATASAMVAPGKGLLACDESTATVRA